MNTYDENGRLLGQSGATGTWGASATDSLTPIDVTATTLPLLQPDSSSIPVLPEITVQASRLPANSWFASLMQPPTVYYVAAGLAFLAWLMNDKGARRRA
ncbi:MAG: hypothetical protein ACYDDA_03755 [Acidiferrobacteraceae bacterium]